MRKVQSRRAINAYTNLLLTNYSFTSLLPFSIISNIKEENYSLPNGSNHLGLGPVKYYISYL